MNIPTQLTHEQQMLLQALGASLGVDGFVLVSFSAGGVSYNCGGKDAEFMAAMRRTGSQIQHDVLMMRYGNPYVRVS